MWLMLVIWKTTVCFAKPVKEQVSVNSKRMLKVLAGGTVWVLLPLVVRWWISSLSFMQKVMHYQPRFYIDRYVKVFCRCSRLKKNLAPRYQG